VEGLSSGTWAAFDLGLAMVRGNMLEKAIEFFESLKKTHPELVGLKRFIDLVRREKEKAAEAEGRPSSWAEDGRKRACTDERKRAWELEDYIRVWERGGMRPYGFLLISGFSTKKQLSPLVMFRRAGAFGLDV
jgi:hypothetical protein